MLLSNALVGGETNGWQGWSIKNIGVKEIVPTVSEKMKLLGCWVVIGHNFEAEATGIHDEKDG